jgi:selenocysteine lyase/cysteine desulfurase
MTDRAGFSLSVGRPGAALHCAAHSHHPWPDVTFTAQQQAWNDAAHMLDRKWDHIFAHVVPTAQVHIARRLSLPNPATVTFGPNTHGFVLRLLSCLPRPARILATSSEFMSFARQIARLEEDGAVTVTRVPSEPFDSFEARFAAEAVKGGHDLVFFSQVFFDSGFVVCDLERIVRAVPDPATFVVIDGYHGFMAVPTDLAAVATRVFYLAGGYKYAMAGEGACFLHCPPGYGARPTDTGWYAGFGALESGAPGVPYATDGSRFMGATFDASALYRFNAVQDWLADRSVAAMLEQVRVVERRFLSHDALSTLVVPGESRRGRFLCFRNERAGEITAKLAAQNVIVDHRGDRLRIGFGIYHTPDDADRLAKALA